LWLKSWDKCTYRVQKCVQAMKNELEFGPRELLAVQTVVRVLHT